VPTSTAELKEGQRVEHAKFGFGMVKAVDVNGTERKATILFEKAGERVLLLSFAKLRVVA
jgi:DNA helicase-2/ATP-dependent DNA helicase PcrA